MMAAVLLCPLFAWAQTAAPASTVTQVTTTTAPAAPEPFDNVLQKIENSDTAMPQLPPPSANGSTTVTTTVTPVPAQTSLASPDAATPVAAPSAAPGSTTVTTTVKTDTPLADVTAVPAMPALPPGSVPPEDLFFDAESLGAGGGLNAAPKNVVRQVNPQTEPASKLIVVTKNYNANSTKAQLVSAQRAVALGRYDSALGMYEALYAKNKRDPNILLGRAVALQHVGQDDAAIRAYEELLDIRPDNSEAQINMLGLVGEKYPAVALQRLMDLQQSQPDNVELLGQIGVLQAKMGYYDEALKYLGMAAGMEPNNASHLYNMAVIADRSGHKTDAMSFYEKALETDSIYGGGTSVPRAAIFERLAQLR